MAGELDVFACKVNWKDLQCDASYNVYKYDMMNMHDDVCMLVL